MTRKFSHPIVLIVVLIFSAFGCNLLSGTSGGQKPGTIKIVNDHVRGSDFFPGGKNLPDTREYGICITNYPASASGLSRPTNDTILAKDGQTTNFELPAGTYTLQEWQFDSEINQDPLYSPVYRSLVRPEETVTIKANQTISFGSQRSLSAPGEFAEGSLNNPVCQGSSQSAGGQPPVDTSAEVTDTPEAAVVETPAEVTDTPEVTTGVWVLKLVEPNVGKTETQFSYPGLACDGGTKVTSSETGAAITATGTCQIKNALTANQVTEHTWSQPPERLVPGEEYSGTMTASSSGMCSWQDSMTEAACNNAVSTGTIVWQGDGWPGSSQEFPFSNLVFGNDYAGTARASNHPTGSFSWKVPDGSTGGGKTLLLQFVSASSGGKVYTNFWYEWQGG